MAGSSFSATFRYVWRDVSDCDSRCSSCASKTFRALRDKVELTGRLRGSVVCHTSIVSHPFIGELRRGLDVRRILTRSSLLDEVISWHERIYIPVEILRRSGREASNTQRSTRTVGSPISRNLPFTHLDHRKRPSSRGQGGGDQQSSQGYSQQQRPSVSSTSGPMGYGASAAYTPNREYQGEFQEPPGKRQRSVGPGDRSMYARPPDQWAGYSQAPAAVNPYATHQPTGYGQDAASTPQQTAGLAYRGTPQESGMVQPSYMPRQSMSEYSTPPHQANPYDQRSYSTQESPASHYGDVSGRMAQPMAVNRHGHPADQIPFPEISYAQMPGSDQQPMMAAGSRNPQYSYQGSRYGASGASSTTLPPLVSSAASSQSVLSSNPAYTMAANDGRYASQHQVQGNQYSGYQTGMPVKEEY